MAIYTHTPITGAVSGQGNARAVSRIGTQLGTGQKQRWENNKSIGQGAQVQFFYFIKK